MGFDVATPVAEIPSTADDNSLQFLDLAGDGHPDIIKLGGNICGFINEAMTVKNSELSNRTQYQLERSELRLSSYSDGLRIFSLLTVVFTWYHLVVKRVLITVPIINQLDKERGPGYSFRFPTDDCIFRYVR